MTTLKQHVNKLLGRKRGEHEADQSIIIISFIIIIFGLIMLSSASSAFAYLRYSNSYYFFTHQLFGLSIGVFAFLFFSKIDYHLWQKYAFGMLVFSVILLLLVFMPWFRAEWGSARSWINVFGYSLQPSEFVKLSFLLYLAAWLESREKTLHEFREGTGPFVVVLGVLGFLMLLQPDIGTLAIITIASVVVYFVGGGNVKHILTLIVIGIIALFIMVKIMPYQANRFKCFFDSDFSKDDICYQVNQSLIAVGSGGLWGRGLGNSRQKFMYLPEVQGDSIFAIIGEETGLIFSSMLVVLFVFLFYRGCIIAKKASDNYGTNLAVGIVTWLSVQAMINIGGMINLLPMTGVPLPLVSYGGSAILAALAGIGILVNISKQTKQKN